MVGFTHPTSGQWTIEKDAAIKKRKALCESMQEQGLAALDDKKVAMLVALLADKESGKAVDEALEKKLRQEAFGEPTQENKPEKKKPEKWGKGASINSQVPDDMLDEFAENVKWTFLNSSPFGEWDYIGDVFATSSSRIGIAGDGSWFEVIGNLASGNINKSLNLDSFSERVKRNAITRLKGKAYKKGADAVINVKIETDIDATPLPSGKREQAVLFVHATGTAVKLKETEPKSS